jgi:hypothetical protein
LQRFSTRYPQRLFQEVSMKLFGKLALLGAALAVSATYSHATPLLFTGSVDTGSNNGVISVTSNNLSVTSMNTAGNYEFPPLTDPCGDGSPNLCTTLTGTITYATFNTATLGSGVVVFTDVVGGDTFTFKATGFSAVTDTTSDQGSVVLTGILSDSLGLYAPDSNATDSFIEDSGGTNFEEDINANAPEPSSLMLLGTGLLGAAGMLFRRRLTA